MPERGRVAGSVTVDEVRMPSTIWLGVRVLGVIASVEGVIMLVLPLLPSLPALAEAALDAGGVSLLSAPLIYLVAVRPITRALAEQATVVRSTTAALRDEVAGRETDAQILRALDQASDESEVMDVVCRTLGVVAPGRPGELLLADSSHAHLRPAATAHAGDAPGCPVQSPSGCVAVRRGQPTTFGASTALDACPRLRDRPREAAAAVCVPITVLGRASGVLHVTGPSDGDDSHRIGRLQLLGAALGDKLGLLRALADSQLQAATDGLTGLMNRRSFEDQLNRLERAGRGYAIVALDLDHFKVINDTHGHAAGDQALRLFAQVLRSVTRAEDLVARLGGEEFVLALPDSGAEQGAAAAERVRSELVVALVSGRVPGFTVSAGVSERGADQEMADVMAAADRALYLAKVAGRDRVVVAGAS